MKRVIALIAGLLTIISVSKADDKPVRFEQLPKAAQKFVTTNFPDSKVIYSTKDDDIISPEYEVALDNGVKIDFKNDGRLEKIEAPQIGVPEGIIPEKIHKYVAKHYPGAKCLEYEVDKVGYEVKLSNGLELTFSTSFHLIQVDD
jgi:hypothetical protein